MKLCYRACVLLQENGYSFGQNSLCQAVKITLFYVKTYMVHTVQWSGFQGGGQDMFQHTPRYAQIRAEYIPGLNLKRKS